jgi:hypothetical protein
MHLDRLLEPMIADQGLWINSVGRAIGNAGGAQTCKELFEVARVSIDGAVFNSALATFASTIGRRREEKFYAIINLGLKDARKECIAEGQLPSDTSPNVAAGRISPRRQIASASRPMRSKSEACIEYCKDDNPASALCC